MTLDKKSKKAPVDARPLLPRNEKTTWAVADERRDALYEELTTVCVDQGIDARVTKSGPYNEQREVFFEAWLRDENNASKRVTLLIKIVPRPYHRFPLEYELAITIADRGKPIRRLREVPDLGLLIEHVLGRGAKPQFQRYRLRTAWWIFWRPSNGLTIKRGGLSVFSRVAVALGFLVLFLFGPWLGLSLTITVDFSTFLFLLAFILYLIRIRRQFVVHDEGRPQFEPRRLRLLDSWHIVVSGLGGDADVFLQRFIGAIGDFAGVGVNYAPEKIAYWGPDGKVERAQHVLTLRQSVVFVQAYRYGNDLYVGWDGYLNLGCWRERTVGYGSDSMHRRVRFTTVEPAIAQLSEYDLNDADVLMEWTHSQAVRLTKALMAEHRIDQEVDFAIVRGNRQTITAEEKTKPAYASAFGRLRRNN